jgi:integrase
LDLRLSVRPRAAPPTTETAKDAPPWRDSDGPGGDYLVRYRHGGSESRKRYGGSFRTLREATIRWAWIGGELAALSVPDLGTLAREDASPLTFAEAARRWQGSRVDVAEATRIQHRTALNRALPTLGGRRLEGITAQDVAALVATLHGEGKARESIRKTLTALAMVFDYAGISPNPARDRLAVKLPREEPEEPNPPSAEHLEAVYRLLASKHRLAFLFLDWSGARVSAIDSTLAGDYDEGRRRLRLRAATTKTRRALWIELPPVLAETIEATIGPREDRDLGARLFQGSGADALRTAIAKACKAEGVPLFSPHDLRHRRISLLHLRGVPWARIGEQVGQRNLAVTANTYTHVLLDERELDYPALLART